MIAVLIMVESGSELDEALQESLFGLGFDKPDFFPDFVGFEEFSGIKMVEASIEFFLMPGWIHLNFEMP